MADEKPETASTEQDQTGAKRGLPFLSAGVSAVKTHRKAILATVGSIVGGVLVVIAIFGVLIYKYHDESNLTYQVSRVIPYPAENVNGQLVSYNEYLFDLNYIKHYYQSSAQQNGQQPIDFNSADGKAKLQQIRQSIIDGLKQDAIVRQLAAKYNITVSDKELNDQLNQLATQTGGLDKVKQVLDQYYGWTLNDFKSKLRFQMIKSKLAQKVANDDTINAAAKAQAEDVLKQVKAGGDFSALAKKYSQDASASNGGDLGWIDKNANVEPEILQAAQTLQVGQTSDIIRTQYGFHIIKVLEKKSDGSVHIQEILIKPVDFNTYLDQQVSKAKISVYYKP